MTPALLLVHPPGRARLWFLADEGRFVEVGVAHSPVVSTVAAAVPVCDTPVVASAPVCDTLIIGDSIVRHVSVKNCETRCHPRSKVADIEYMLPCLLPDLSHVESLVVHVGTNDTKAETSELLKSDYSDLIECLMWTRKNFIISGPLPCINRGDMTYSRLHQLHIWLKGYCSYWNIPYVDNFLLFSNRYELFNRDGLHLNRDGAKLLSSNILYVLESLRWEPGST